jgi:hypothetical protein
MHRLNFGVILLSACSAWFFPLQTFLVAYAVLGPFHYLTEIAWLGKKRYFFSDGLISPRFYVLSCVLLGSVASLDLYFRRGWAGYAIGALLVLSLSALVKNVPVLLGALALTLVTKHLVHGYGLFLAVFVPTVLHVYGFTLIFIISGALRGRNHATMAWVNTALLLALPVAMLVLGGHGAVEMPGTYWMSSETVFASVHEYLAGLIGLGMHVAPGMALNTNAVAVFRFLGFIYLHHYLNWFAKTELLAWHRVPRRSWVGIGVVYAAMLGAYAYNFTLGFYASYFLGLMHVLLELPLDWRSSLGVLRESQVKMGLWRMKRGDGVLASD